MTTGTTRKFKRLQKSKKKAAKKSVKNSVVTMADKTKKKTSAKKKPSNGQVKKREATTGALRELKTGSTRTRMFKALNKFPSGMTAQAIKEKTGMAKNSGHLAVLLKEELENKRIKIEVHDVKEKDVRFYLITSLGLKDLKSGKLDKTSMSGNRIGQKWTNKRRTADKKK